MIPHRKPFIGVAKIYSLSDKVGNVFYIGCTLGQVEGRLYEHIQEAKSTKTTNNSKKSLRIRELDYDIRVDILDYIEVSAFNSYEAIRQLCPIENEWILKYILAGYDITNSMVRTSCKLPNAKEIQLAHDRLQLRNKQFLV